MTRKPLNTAARSLAKFSLTVVLVFLALALYFYSLLRPVNPSDLANIEFEINRGDSATVIAKNLSSAKLIRSPFLFEFVVKQSGLRSKLQSGFFELSPSMSTYEIAVALTKGVIKSEKFTVPEGYRLEQIADLAASGLGLSRTDFMTAGKGLEGQLFPDTYFLAKDITAQELVDLMHANFVKKVGDIDSHTLILASLIERETKGNAEKPVVAGILNKRLLSTWPLELDATIQYFLGKTGNWWPNTTLLDRKLTSPYNTYLHQGLPPTPICNPGVESINAARTPQDSPYWYYLHDKRGDIHYATTNEEQNANIKTYIESAN